MGRVGYDWGRYQMTDFGETERVSQTTPLADASVVTVCGGKISDPDRYPSALYRGQRVYFCLRACLRAFEADPDRFMAGEIEHPTDEDDSLTSA